MGRIYAVVSAKGGVGKTTTAANLAAALAAADLRVAVVDGDLGMANLASALGVDVGEVTLHDVLATDSDAGSGSDGADPASDSSAPDLAASIHEGPHGLSVVPGSPALDAFSRTDPERLDGVLADLAADHDYVILDTGAGLSNDTVAPLTFVDEILLVSTPTRDALGDTDKTRQVAERLGTTVAGAALLRADPAAAESETVVETLDAGVLGTVPDAAEIRRASDAGEPLTTFAPDSPAAAAFASLAASLTGEHVAAPTADATDAGGDVAGPPATEDDTDDNEVSTADEAPDPSADSGNAPGGDEVLDGPASQTAVDHDEPADADDGESAEAVAESSPAAGIDEGSPDADPSASGATEELATDEAGDEGPADEADDERPTDGAVEASPADAADDERPVDEVAEGLPADGTDTEESADEVAEESPADEPHDGGPADDVTKELLADEADDRQLEDESDDTRDSPVGPADPEMVGTADDPADDAGVHTTPLEEVPIDEVETGAGSDDPGAAAPDIGDQESPAGDADDGAESDDDDTTESDGDSGGGGFFSRFFG